MTLIIGDMRHNIIVKRVTITRDELNGSIIETWNDQFKLKAKIPRGSGTKTISNDEIFNTSTLTLMTHYRDVIEKDRIYYNGDNYNILLINEIGFKEGLEIVCKKINE